MTAPKTFQEASDKAHEIMSHAKSPEYAALRVRKAMAPFLCDEFLAQWERVARRRALENVRSQGNA